LLLIDEKIDKMEVVMKTQRVLAILFMFALVLPTIAQSADTVDTSQTTEATTQNDVCPDIITVELCNEIIAGIIEASHVCPNVAMACINFIVPPLVELDSYEILVKLSMDPVRKEFEEDLGEFIADLE